MAVFLQAALFALPFLLYALWLRLGGRRLRPSTAALTLAAVGIACGVAAAAWYGLGRSLDRGERYVPARVIEGGEVRP